jgi:hypothetical protein
MTRLEEAIDQAKAGREYTNAEIIALAPIFQFFFPTIEALDHVCATPTPPPPLPPASTIDSIYILSILFFNHSCDVLWGDVM